MSGTEAYPWLSRYPKEVDWHAPIDVQPLSEILREAARRFPDRPAYDFLGRRTNWGKVRSDAVRIAAGLQALGFAKGDRIGLMLPNCPAYPTLFFAAMEIGLIVVNFNPLYTDIELERQARDSGVRMMATLDLADLFGKAERLLAAGVISHLLVCDFAAMLTPMKAVLFRIAKRRDIAAVPRTAAHVRLVDLIRRDVAPEPVTIDPRRDIALLQYTGGTTGTPKGAMLTHANIYANAVQGTRWFHHMRPGQERVMAVLPFFHIFALTTVMMFAAVGAGEMVMLPRFTLDEAIKTVARRRPTYFPGVPTMFNAIASATSEADLSSIRYCISGGAPLPVEVKRRFEARTGCVLVEGYGLTEASPCVCCNPPGGLNKEGSMGLPMGQTIVELRDPAEPARAVAHGERGEICVSGPQVMAGYWNRPEESAATFTPDGWLRTGDIGTVDEDGYFFVVDRIKDLILCGGYNVYPRMVEEAIYRHPAVGACTVIGVPDPYRGETVKAFVVIRPGQSLTEAALIDFLRDLLSPIELPKQIEFRDSLPTTQVGKLSRKALADEEAAKRAAAAAPG